MALKCGLILCWFLTNIIYAYCAGDPFSNSFIKKDNSFEQSYGDENSASLPEGYAEKVDKLLRDYKAGKIQFEALNTFNSGLEEYYIYRAREISSTREFIRMSPRHEPYPFPLSNYSDEVIKFNNVQVFEFPGLKKHGNSSAYDDEKLSVSRSKATIAFKSDVIIFTGNFEIYNSSFFFVYSLKNAVFSIYLDASWKGETINTFIKNVLQFSSEELLHTYDSSYEHSTEASEILSQHFNKALLNSFLPKLSAKVSQTFNGVYLSNNVKVLASLQKSILSAITESAIQYATAKGLNTFEVGAGVNVQSYKNIKVEGVLNFIDHKLINSSKEIPQSLSDLENLSDVIRLTYANEGEKQAFISFVVVNGGQEISKKFKIKSIQISISYKVLSVRGLYKVSRNKDAFHNGSGFLIKFELDSFDPSYEPLITQIGNYVASGIEKTLGTA